MQQTPLDNTQASFRALNRALPLIFAAGIAAAGLGYGIARKTPPSYEVHFSYIVALQERDTSQGFRYDGYYALSGTELFSSTLASLIASPEMIVQAYQEARLPVSTQDPFALTKRVRAQKAASQVVQVTVVDGSKEKAEALAKAVVDVTQHTVRDYNTKNADSNQFSITSTTPWTGVVRVAAIPVAIIVGVLSSIIAAMVVLFKEAFKRGKQ